ncbi:MAG: hypothetical protein M3461_21250 [Pseudomonadota bacterium]|nr:hypothetical protein [Pseudomonadota bacterium]
MSELNDGLDAYQQGDYELALPLLLLLAEAGNANTRIGKGKYPELLITTSQRSSVPVCRGYLQILRLQRNTGVRL